MNLELADSGEWKKMLQAASAPGNDFLVGFRADPRLPNYRAHMKRKNVEAKAANTTKLSAEERLKRVNVQAEFVGLYANLSADVHNNTSHRKHRHTRFEGNEVVFELYSARRGYGDAELLSLAKMLMHSSEDMHKRFGSGKAAVKGIRYVADPARERAYRANKPACPIT